MNKVYEALNYSIYDVYTNEGNRYYVCLPNNQEESYEVYCSFSRDYMDMQRITDKMNEIYNIITGTKKNIIYVNIIVNMNSLSEAAHDNDQRLYDILFANIQKNIRHAYDTIVNEKHINISNVVTMVKQNDDDTKFIDWLEINIPNYVHSISIYDKVNSPQNVFSDDNLPFTDIADATGGSARSGNGGGENVNQDNAVKKKKRPSTSHGYVNIILFSITVMLSLAIIGLSIYIYIR